MLYFIIIHIVCIVGRKAVYGIGFLFSQVRNLYRFPPSLFEIYTIASTILQIIQTPDL